jgi:hypothetical protein
MSGFYAFSGCSDNGKFAQNRPKKGIVSDRKSGCIFRLPEGRTFYGAALTVKGLSLAPITNMTSFTGSVPVFFPLCKTFTLSASA